MENSARIGKETALFMISSKNPGYERERMERFGV
jgi:hypothetical protein